MDVELLRERPFLTGLLLGLVVWLFGAGADAGAGLVALFLFPVGVVLAIFGERWHRPTGQALAGAGATVIVVDILAGILRGVVDLVAPTLA